MPDTALIVIDMLNAYDHEGADVLAESAEKALPQIVALRDEAARRDDVLLVYVNDNYDQWHAGQKELVDTAREGKRPDLVEPLAALKMMERNLHADLTPASEVFSS